MINLLTYSLLLLMSVQCFSKQKIVFEQAIIQLYNGKQIQGLAKIQHHHTEDIVIFKLDENAQKTIVYHLSEIHNCTIGAKKYHVDYVNRVGDVPIFAHVLTERLIDRNGYVVDKFYVYKNNHQGKNNAITKRSVGYRIADQYHSMEFFLSNAKETLQEFFLDNKAMYQKINSSSISTEEDLKILF